MTPSSPQPTGSDLSSLLNVTRLANTLAKQLSGPARTLAYRIKAEACSSLIVGGQANINGIDPGGIISLDLNRDKTARCHVRLAHLSEAAQQIVEEQVNDAHAISITKGIPWK